VPTQHDDIVPVGVKRAREQSSDLAGAARHDDSHG
jgi:hypothetical protein